jgi:hypothetical protein
MIEKTEEDLVNWEPCPNVKCPGRCKDTDPPEYRDGRRIMRCENCGAEFYRQGL